MAIYDDDPVAGPPPAEYSGTQGYGDACMEEPSWWCDERQLTQRDRERAREVTAKLLHDAAHPDPARVAKNEEEMRKSIEQTDRWYEAWLKRGGR